MGTWQADWGLDRGAQPLPGRAPLCRAGPVEALEQSGGSLNSGLSSKETAKRQLEGRVRKMNFPEPEVIVLHYTLGFTRQKSGLHSLHSFLITIHPDDDDCSGQEAAWTTSLYKQP